MVWPHRTAPAPRTAADVADADDLRSVIAAALATIPIDEDALRRGVWTFVGTERDAGASPADVITALTDLIDEARFTPMIVQLARTRRVILWCVEAYFGHLGGDGLGRESTFVPDMPRPASNR